MKTQFATKENIQRKWFIVDAEGKTLGRLATRIATVLRGKHKPTFTPHVDTGDHVIVVNAEKVRFTGAKLRKKIYYHHTGYPGALKSLRLEELMSRAPEKVLQEAVWGMLPKGPLGKAMFRKLKVYCGSGHGHEAQKPEPLKLENV
ncbi:MAG: 50S ribosomal protein L13 [Nitrospirae bacterium]|nr:50S ribosomal protein L13 [Nitrospirota bacterium]